MNQNQKSPLYDAPKVGGDVLTFCSRCKMELAHVIVSMVDLVPAKVICKTCRNEHKYRRAAGKNPLAPKRASTPRIAKTTIRLSELWEKKIAESRAIVPKKYTIQETFKAKDLLEHVKFGMGVVEEVVPPQKVRVLFQDEQRVLIHGKK